MAHETRAGILAGKPTLSPPIDYSERGVIVMVDEHSETQHSAEIAAPSCTRCEDEQRGLSSSHQHTCGAQAAEQAHFVRIEHDAESHAFAADCHDDCKASLVCPGVTDACRTWWECVRCRKVVARLDEEGEIDYDERLNRRGEAHGVDHLRIDGMWMTPSNQCLSASCDEHDASELIPTLPDGDYPVSFDWEEGYVEVRLINPDPSLPPEAPGRP